MDIKITGRHITVSDKLKEYAEKKIQKLETYFRQLLHSHVILGVEKLDHTAEVIINGDGVQFHGKEKAADHFSSIDLLFEKMEKQIRGYKEKHSSHKVADLVEAVYVDYTGPEGTELKLKQASNKPIEKIEAYLQMKIGKMDFILFKLDVSKVDSSLDYLNRNYAVMYNEGTGVKFVELPYEHIKDNKFEKECFAEYDLVVSNDSVTKPEINFKKAGSCSILLGTITDAVKTIESSGAAYLPFFNTDSLYFNVIYRHGKNLEVLVPAF